MVPTPANNGDTPDITLKDVVVHMQHMGQLLNMRMDTMEKRLTSKIDANTKGIQANTLAIEELSVRITALDEDLQATMRDTFAIRRHVKMPLPEEN